MSPETQTPKEALHHIKEKQRLEEEGYQFHITPHSFCISKKNTFFFDKKTSTQKSHCSLQQQYHKNLTDSITIAQIHEKSTKTPQ